jgi:NAD(P)-dependent dehydrogenase (short-subunit alcohol dehydrogenase family)
MCGCAEHPRAFGRRLSMFMRNSGHSSRVWFITGCSSGLGRALALDALTKGDRVVATARNVDSVAALTEAFPETCCAAEVDVTDAGTVAAGIAKAVEVFGRIDVVVNNAGCGLIGAFEELDEAQIEQNFRVNFFGSLAVIRAALPTLRAQGSGHIVNISAAAAIANYPGFSIYGAAKCALEGASEALAAELKPLGIHVTIVQPGPFRTEFVGRSLAKATRTLPDYERTSGKFRRLIESMDGKQPGDPAKAAEAIRAAVESTTPPLRLVLGKYANDKTTKTLAASSAELATWSGVTIATEFVRTS